MSGAYGDPGGSTAISGAYGDPSGSAAISGPTVTVVGGGLAGITAALDCARAGARVTLLESRGRLGGRAYSFERHGLRVDNGQHVFLRCCTAYRDLLARLEAEPLVELQPRLDIPVLTPGRRGPRVCRLRRSSLPAPLHLAGSMLRYAPLSAGERASAAHALARLRAVDCEAPASDERSFGAWLCDHRQSPRAVEGLWELIVRPTLNLRCEDASLAQAAQVFQVGLLSGAAAGDVGYARVPLGEIHDAAARRALERAGVEVRLRHGASAVVPAGPEGLRVQTAGGEPVDSEAVIVAVPPHRAARLLPPEAGVDPGALERLGRSPIVNLHVVYDRPVLEPPFAAAVGSPVQWVFDRTAGAGVTEGQYLAVSLSAADEELAMTAEELRGTYLPALAELLPGAREAEVHSFFVTREHSATFRAGPGARALRPGPRTALAGLMLAGDWTDTGWPATMESAVRSGQAAARALLAQPRPAGEGERVLLTGGRT